MDGEEECSDSDKDGLEDRPESEFAHNSEMSFLAAAMANLPNFDPAKASLVHADNVVIEKVRRLLEDNAAADGSEQEDSKAQDISTSLQVNLLYRPLLRFPSLIVSFNSMCVVVLRACLTLDGGSIAHRL